MFKNGVCEKIRKQKIEIKSSSNYLLTLILVGIIDAAGFMTQLTTPTGEGDGASV